MGLWTDRNRCTCRKDLKRRMWRSRCRAGNRFVVEITGKKRNSMCLAYCDDVFILQDDDVPSTSYVQWSFPCPGCITGDGLNLDAGGSLPPEMLPALRERVQTHLLGRPLTPSDRVQIAGLKPEALMPVERILVTTGTLGRPYEVLGEVSYNTRETINIASIFTDTVFRFPLSVAAAGKTAELSRGSMQDRLRQVARQDYGNEVDAVLNMTYDVDQEGEAYGSGLAVRFVEQSPTPAGPSPVPAAQNRTIHDRLEELKRICEQELITEADCEAKRKSLVDSL